MSLKSLVGRKMTKKVKFLDTDVVIAKLSVAEVLEIQKEVKQANDTEQEGDGFAILKKVIRLSAADATDLTDADFDAFPLDELTKLSGEIMKFSGISSDQGKSS
jgi:hypothetical protein